MSQSQAIQDEKRMNAIFTEKRIVTAASDIYFCKHPHNSMCLFAKSLCMSFVLLFGSHTRKSFCGHIRLTFCGFFAIIFINYLKADKKLK
jgi:hypothetical protein